MIKDGQPVILYFSPSAIKLIHKDSLTTTNTRVGPLKHTSICRYNTIIHLKNGPVSILRPTHHLISNTICSTQVVFDYDASFLCFIMGLRSTDVLFEAGFGSGVLTGSLARFVRLVYSCERVVDRIRNVGENVIVYEGDCCDLMIDLDENGGGKDLHRDSTDRDAKRAIEIDGNCGARTDGDKECDQENADHPAGKDVRHNTNGSSATDDNENAINRTYSSANRTGAKNVIDQMMDGVVLDMPEPWLAIPILKTVLKRNRTMCVFVISIQQVTKTLRAMHTFKDVKVYENVGREYFLKKSSGKRMCVLMDNQYMHTGYLIFGRR